MRLLAFVCASALALSLIGCATSPTPAGYVGPLSRIYDFGEKESDLRGVFYYAAEFNGKTIDNGLAASRRANAGRGFAVTILPFNRVVPSGHATIKLEARTFYGAPIQEIAMAALIRRATNTIEVDLMPDVEYKVTGTLSEGHDEVWLEERWSLRVGKSVPSM